MTRARFFEQKPNVETHIFDDTVYAYIYLNETEGDTEIDDDHPNSMHFYEYDYNEFCELVSNIDLDDLSKNPSDYLDYEPVQILSQQEKMQAQVLYTAMMTDTVLED